MVGGGHSADATITMPPRTRWSMFALAAACLAGSVAVGQARSAPSATPENKVALGVSVSDPGQPPDLNNYVAAVGQKPAIVMWFQSFGEPLYYDNQLPPVSALGAIPMISWAPARRDQTIPLAALASGVDDSYIQQAAEAATNSKIPLFIRFAPEMNLTTTLWGPGASGNTPQDYVNAWRHVVSIFRSAGATNVRWVWSPNVDCGGRCPFEAFYPGDAWVDWVALDGYNYGPVDDVPWMSLQELFGPSYTKLIALTSKPLMIAETASTEQGGNKAAWIQHSFFDDLPTSLPEVRAIIWWQHTDATDWRVDSSAASLSAYRAVAASPRYSADPILPSGLLDASPSASTAGGTSSVANPASAPPPVDPPQEVLAPSSTPTPPVYIPATAPTSPASPLGPSLPHPAQQPMPTAISIIQSPATTAFSEPLSNSATLSGKAKSVNQAKSRAEGNHAIARNSRSAPRAGAGQRSTSSLSRLPRWFHLWANWHSHGVRPDRRPPSAPSRIPRWAWQALQQHSLKHKRPASSR